MATYRAFVKLGYKDDAGRITEVTYRLVLNLEDDYSNIVDVTNLALDTRAHANQMSSSRIETCQFIVELPGEGTAEDYSNNQVVGFTRVTFAGDLIDSVEIPSWDSARYEQDVNNMLDTAYNDDMAVFVQQLFSTSGNQSMDNGAIWSQSRARKGRQTVG